MGAALVAAAIVAPWLVWAPMVRSPAAIIVLGAIAIVAACHGWGRLVARAARCEADAALSIQWGIAAVVALAGVMIALHVYDARLLVIAGATAHSADLAMRFGALGAAWEQPRRSFRYWAIPAALVAMLALVHVLAAAGQGGTRAFDDDANVVAQVQRLAQTGGLGDAIGFPRMAQLGGHEALSGLVTAFADVGAMRVVDLGIGFTLFLVLAIARIKPRDAGSAIWALLLVIAASAYRIPWHDPAPLWIPAGLIAALVFTVEDSPRTLRAAIPIALLAGSLSALRNELAPIAATFLLIEWWAGRRPWRDDVPRVAVLASALAIVVPYAIARANAWHAVDPSVRALIGGKHASMLVALPLAAAIAVAVLPLLALLTRELESAPARWIAWAGSVGVAAVAAGLVGERPYSVRFLWPLALATVAVIVVGVVRRGGLLKVAIVLGLLACVVLRDDAPVFRRAEWSYRYYLTMFDVEYARHAAAEGGGYDRAFAAIPAGATVAVWVDRPELLDHGRFHIADLRTPRIAPLRDATDERFDRVVAASDAQWLVVEPDNALRRRGDASSLYRLACPTLTEGCADRLEAYLVRGPIVTRADGIAVISLR